MSLELEVDSDCDHIEGRVIDQLGQSLPFSGWLELIAALRTLCGSSVDPVGERGAGPSSSG
jgi:hypothetical protein